MSNLTLAEAWEKLRALGEKKPAWHIAQANIRGYSDFLSRDNIWHRLSSKGGNTFSIRKI